MEDVIELRCAHSSARHAGVDLNVDSDRLGRFIHLARGSIERLDLVWVPYRRRQVVFDDSIFLTTPEATEQEDASSDPARAQSHAFIGGRHGKPFASIFL